ncbi:MAG: hypothetical protein Q8M07_07825 [Prosthecobacter sp.]|nr:hypothetical protein [Prosthecobacter sp.]
MDKLTFEQEQFAQHLATGASQAGAYREAYSRSRKWKPESVYARASVLASSDKVAQRVAELRRPAARACEVTVESLTRDLMVARAKALETKQVSAAVAATMGIAKLHGLLVEDRKNARDPFEGFTTKEMVAALDHVRAAIRKAKKDLTP